MSWVSWRCVTAVAITLCLDAVVDLARTDTVALELFAGAARIMSLLMRTPSNVHAADRGRIERITVIHYDALPLELWLLLIPVFPRVEPLPQMVRTRAHVEMHL